MIAEKITTSQQQQLINLQSNKKIITYDFFFQDSTKDLSSLDLLLPAGMTQSSLNAGRLYFSVVAALYTGTVSTASFE